jgi:hypothetical protein
MRITQKGEVPMEWSRIRSFAHEAEAWMSLVVNSWLIFVGAKFIIGRVSSHAGLLAKGAFLLSSALVFTMPITIVVSLFRKDPDPIYWQIGIGIALSLLSHALFGIQAVGRLLRNSN